MPHIYRWREKFLGGVNMNKKFAVLNKIYEMGEELTKRMEDEERKGNFPKELAEEFLIYLKIKKLIAQETGFTPRKNIP